MAFVAFWLYHDYTVTMVPFSIEKISKVTSPVLVIHGTEDEVIEFSHGLAMYERCVRPVEPLWVEGTSVLSLNCTETFVI